MHSVAAVSSEYPLESESDPSTATTEWSRWPLC